MPLNKPKPHQVAPSPSWTLDAGISYSLLSRFVNCRERFRLYAVEGVREGGRSSSKASMDWGTYFHELIELHAKHPHISAQEIFRMAKRKLPLEERKIAQIVFTEYVEWFKDETFSYFGQEVVFDEMYALPNGRKVRLVGKTDEIIMNDDGVSLMIQENKTKERIDEYKIESGIAHDLQSLMYAVCISQKFKRPVNGIVYNVIRKPTHRPKKIVPTKTQLKEDPTLKTRYENQTEFLERLKSEIKEDPAHFFLRWELALPEDHVERWRRSTFDPLLMQLVMWWDSVKHDPFSPWTTPAMGGDRVGPNGKPITPEDQELVINPHHYQRPFGVYDAMTNGIGDFFDLLTRNRRIGTTAGNPIFTELPEIQRKNRKLGLTT